MNFKDSKLMTILISGAPTYTVIVATPVLFSILQISSFTRGLALNFNWSMYLIMTLISLIFSYDLAKHNLKEENK